MERIRSAQLRASLAVNREMGLLYWQIGRDILQRQAQEGWGAKVIDRLAADLHHAFPDMTGLSPRNLKYMRAFAAAWPDEPIVQGPLAQITWYHNIALLEKLRTESGCHRPRGWRPSVGPVARSGDLATTRSFLARPPGRYSQPVPEHGFRL